VAVGSFFNDCGAFFTPFIYMFREREKIYDLFEMLSGQRVLYNYMRIGGFNQDMPDEFLPAVRKIVRQMESRLVEYDRMLAENEIAIARSKGVGILPRELAISVGASGPVLRASGVKWDIRKAEPYSIYDRFEFDIPTGTVGDCYDRWRVRVAEMWQSVRILKQALQQVPSGPVKTPVPQFYHPPAGEVYGRIEAPKGELGFYIVSDNSIAPYRCHIRAPSFINLTALKEMVVGWKIQDLIIIFGSIDITMGEVDR
jgi:NADH-quinone oxidoreductase subunit D